MSYGFPVTMIRLLSSHSAHGPTETSWVRFVRGKYCYIAINHVTLRITSASCLNVQFSTTLTLRRLVILLCFNPLPFPSLTFRVSSLYLIKSVSAETRIYSAHLRILVVYNLGFYSTIIQFVISFTPINLFNPTLVLSLSLSLKFKDN